MWIKSVSAKKSRGHRTSKIVKFRKSYGNGHLPYYLFILLRSPRALKHDVAWICVRSKDAQEQLARTSLNIVIKRKVYNYAAHR